MGIPVKIHITFLLVLPIFTWVFAINPQPIGFAGIGSPMNYVLGAVATILLFASVLLHEFGHSWVALRHGTSIRGITLFIFGGVSEMDDPPREPATEAKMAFIGPLISLIVGLAFYGVYLGANSFSDSIWVQILPVLGIVNIVLFAFNLLPAFPMDGGRVLRSLLASRMSYLDATHRAVYVGKLFAFGMGLLGFLGFNFWLILIALFIYIGASEEEQGTVVEITLEDVKVRDLMSEDVTTVVPEDTVHHLVDLMFETKHMGYPVLKDGQLVGIVTFQDVKDVNREQWNNVQVGQIMNPEVKSVNPSDDAAQALQMIRRNNIGRLPVMQNGDLIGIISRTDITRAMDILSYEE